MIVPDPITSMELSMSMETLCLTAGKRAAFIPLEAPPGTLTDLPAPTLEDVEPGPCHVAFIRCGEIGSSRGVLTTLGSVSTVTSMEKNEKSIKDITDPSIASSILLMERCTQVGVKTVSVALDSPWFDR
jgi:hypothetical protein